ncbi:hypothetical protein Dda_5175 [Drechslerella dactyloides]|uniref:Uncharacterized protein n=1 Tax=Drechslerella dactyloides TaxID=74499 RepID=A0AAD6NJY8_DREDA|nr:hypothetical protein Dda_5175 [Drechslerella dactyloides]
MQSRHISKIDVPTTYPTKSNTNMPPGFKASLETLPLELQEEIFAYVVGAPKVNIIIRDAVVLQEENHFNILPQNPPHKFAPHVCRPRHLPQLPAVARRRECYSAEHTDKAPQKGTDDGCLFSLRPRPRAPQYGYTGTFALSLIYQFSPIPSNVVCLSKNLHRAVASIWSILRRRLKKLLDSQIVVTDEQNYRYFGTYKIIWFTDFVENPSEEMLNLCRESRFIFDLDNTHSFVATFRTIREPIARAIRSVVTPDEMVLYPWFATFLRGTETIGVVLNEGTVPPAWCLEALGEGEVERLEVIQSRWGRSSVELKDPLPDTPRLSRYKFKRQELTEEEVHDRGRYIYNSFRKTKTCYYQGRATLEDVVSIFQRDRDAADLEPQIIDMKA